jgi:hypothetical protein
MGASLQRHLLADSMSGWVSSSLLGLASVDDAAFGAAFGATLYLNSVHFVATPCNQ